ncbi:plexin A3-like [Acyrthosiphon pisum]|uniref:IPT/TIG domain-containing protein n=1 Tax=Acyrthosiphon pisum TaxID=7029 RepID=A0A8R2B793_ACYPI|nr:plexin A3-like [Acyrthosiphon pisum]|eukprot:XP_008184613.1 PREDICTED: plexin A3-like [Acyrthosiphon pisum]
MPNLKIGKTQASWLTGFQGQETNFRMVFVSVLPVNSLKYDITKDVVNCSELKTCTKCAENPSCSWSLQRQICVSTTHRPELLMVNMRAHCPQFTIIDSYINKIHLPFTYKVKVSNDVSGFVKYLSKSNIKCSLRGVTYNGTVSEVEDTINCESISNDNLGFDKQRLMIYYYSIVIDGVPLRIDDGVNNYFTVYNNHFCDVSEKTKHCVACSWDSEFNSFYYKRCSEANMCTGLFEYYDSRNATDFADTTTDDRYNKNITALQLSKSGPPSGACPDMMIQSVEPLTAPWSGGVTLVVTVKNHDVLSESRKVTVTVAGRDCVYPKTINSETISCTVGPPKNDYSARNPIQILYGPVHVTYGPLRLTSTQKFQFVYPELTDMSPTCGPVSGGTLLHITGRFLDFGSMANVFVGPADVPCELVARYEDRVMCVTGPADGPAVGAVTIVFDKFLRKKVGVNSTTTPPFKPLQFVYAGDPELDAKQPFSGIASGGTYIPVRGHHLACVRNATLYVDDPDGVRHYAGCAVRNDTFMECWSPALDPPRSLTPGAPAPLLNFGFRVRIADHTMDLSPQPDFPGYRLYADPAFTDFETDGRNVTINGRHLDRGYQPSVDLDIRLRNHKGTPCTVISTQRRQIVCVRPPSSPAEGELRDIYVTVGRELARTIKKKIINTDKRIEDGPLGVFEKFLLIVGILTGLCFMSLLAAAVYMVWNNKWDIRRYL